MSMTQAYADAVAYELAPQGRWQAYERGAGFILTDGEVEIFGWTPYASTPSAKRAEWSPSYPEGTRDVKRYNDESSAETSTALTRDPKAVARQIERNVLPKAREWTKEYTERLAARADAESKRRAYVEKLRELFPGLMDRDNDGTDIGLYPVGNWYGSVKLYHEADRVSLDIHGIPADVALQVLEILAGIRREG